MTENVCTLNVTTELNSDPEYRSKEDGSDDDLCARIETGAAPRGSKSHKNIKNKHNTLGDIVRLAGIRHVQKFRHSWASRVSQSVGIQPV